MKLSILILSLLVTLIKIPSAFALPIFSENRAMRLASGVVLYPDSEDPALVYYFPGTGELKKDAEGLPLFGMTYWGLRKGTTGELTSINENSGAFISFVAKLNFTDQQRREIEAHLGANARVAVLPIQASTIELQSTASGGMPLATFFKEFNLSRHGGQADADIAINGILNGQGALVLAGQLRNPQVMKIDYCYKALGLSPLFKGVIQLNWSQIYDTLRTSFRAGGFFNRKEVSVTIQRLIRNGSLKIQIDAAPDSEAKYDDFVMKVADMLMNRMFKAEIPPSVPGSDGSAWSFFRVSLDYGRSEVSEDITISFSRRDQTFHESCIPVSVAGIKDHFSSVVQTADGINIF